MLLYISDPATQQYRRFVTDISVAEEYFTTLRLHQPVEAAKERGFARAAFTHERRCSPRRNVDAHIFESDDAAEAMRHVSGGKRDRHALNSDDSGTESLSLFASDSDTSLRPARFGVFVRMSLNAPYPPGISMTLATTKSRRIGSQGLETFAIGLGCMGMSEFYGPSNEKESIATIHKALELGVNMLDTADMYGPFKNEELVGRAIKGKRDRVVIATKFGNVRDPKDPTKRGINGRPEYVRQACEGSLKRLAVDTIDLYYQHRVDKDTPIEDTVGAMSELVREGKVRYIGLSEASVATIRRAHKVHPISAVQTEYSLWTRDPEEGLLDALRMLGIGFVAYSPLGRGFLTGQIKRVEDLAEDDFRRQNPRFQGDNFKKNLELVAKVEEIAEEHKCTAAQLALAWALAQGDDIVPIPGTRHPERAEENVGALDIVLSENDLRRIDLAAPKGAAAGDRYAEGGMKVVNL